MSSLKVKIGKVKIGKFKISKPQDWAVLLIAWVLGISFSLVLCQPVGGHYQTFTQAARALWSEKPAYGVPWAGNLFFYSPSCAMFLFGPLSLMSDRFGLLLYLVISVAILIYGTLKLAKIFYPERDLSGFWLLVAQPLFSAIAADKPELLITGIVLICTTWIIEGVNRAAAAVLLAMVANWKLQPLPAIALIGLVQIGMRGDYLFILLFGIALLFWYVIPFVFLPWSYATNEHQIWYSTLKNFTQTSYANFDNFFSFLQNTVGIQLPYSAAVNLSCAAAIFLAVTVVIEFKTKSLSSEKKLKESVLFSLGVGCAYTVIFSPLQQVNAYILLLPTYFLSFYTYQSSSGFERKFWYYFLGVIFMIMTFSYSDLIPMDLRISIRHMTIRSGTTLALLVALIFHRLKRNFFLLH
jgi:hypothetical protein